MRIVLPMLRCDDVGHRYRGRQALHGVSLEVGGGVTALIGVNGAGKSTLLSIAGGALRPTSGHVEVAGLGLYRATDRRRALGKVALMPQTAAFPGGMTAREVVEYLTWMRGFGAQHARIATDDALRRVLLSDRAGSKVRSLSGGMLRRLCLAQAIATGAEVVLLDEPSTGLDPEQRRTMVQLLADLDSTLLLSSHVMEDVADLASRVIILDAGAVVFDGPLPELTAQAVGPADAKTPEAGFLAVLARRPAGAR